MNNTSALRKVEALITAITTPTGTIEITHMGDAELDFLLENGAEAYRTAELRRLQGMRCEIIRSARGQGDAAFWLSLSPERWYASR